MKKISHNPDVLSCLANLSNDEVFTPPKLANEMLDMLPQELFTNKHTTFFDPVSKSGVFLREIARRLMEGLKKEIPDNQERINHIFENQIFGIAITELTSLLSRRSVYCSKTANGKYSICESFNDKSGNIKFDYTEHRWENDRCKYCGASKEVYSRDKELETHAYQFIHTDNPKNIFRMKFDVIIGNPPYQLSDGGAQASAMPIYNKFVEQAKKLNPRFLIMITPSRWFAGGRGLNSFRDEMITDTRIRVMHDFLNASECFPGVEIKGGVSYFLWDRDKRGLCKIYTHENNKIISTSDRFLKEEDCDIFIRYNEAIPILKKVRKHRENTIDIQVSSQRPFGLRTYFQGKNKYFKDAIKVYANKKTGYIKKEEVLTNEQWISQHKVIAPRAIGTGDSKSDRINPIYSEPGSCCTETYVVFGPYSSKEEAENVMSYIKTKFFHFLVTLQKNTMMASKAVYSFAPIQDFSESWTDDKLFKKYELTKEEIAYIQNMIHPAK